MRGLIACAVLLSTVCTDAATAQRRMPPIPLRMVFERAADGGVSALNVEIRNVEAGPICVSADYAAPARVVLTYGPNGRALAVGSDAAPQDGCAELAPGATLSISYDVRALFPDQSYDTPRLCYSLPLRAGGAADGGDLSLHWSGCSQARQ